MSGQILPRFTLAEVLADLPDNTQIAAYIDFHKYRYLLILNLIAKLIEEEKLESSGHILDVGPAYQTHLIRKSFPAFSVHSLGIEHPLNIRKEQEFHLNQDLNFGIETPEPHKSTIDLMIFAEVLEHLYTPPTQVLKYLCGFIKPGGIMILQTPNAVALDRRLKMLMGKNPYNLIAAHRQNHFREYTLSELHHFAKECGMEPFFQLRQNYFNPDKTFSQRLYRRLNNFMPGSLRDGITLMLKRVDT